MTTWQNPRESGVASRRPNIAVDAMGGDNAPDDVVGGVVQAVRARGSRIVMVGDEVQVGEALKRAADNREYETIHLHHASQVIAMGESPAAGVKVKKDASVLVAARLVRERRAAAMVSAGNTGATMTAALFMLGRLEGVQRPALAVPIPRANGVTIVIDAGANVDSRPMHLAQAAVMGEVYAEQIFGAWRPRIGLLNVGAEEGKGTDLVQEAYRLLYRSDLNFIGNVEGRDVMNGRADVVVCDGFVGNIVLKLAEGIVLAVPEMLRKGLRDSGLLAKLGMWLSIPVFRRFKRLVDPERVGGAPLLGVNGNCVVGHGASSPWAMNNAIALAERLVEININSKIRERLKSLRLSRSKPE